MLFAQDGRDHDNKYLGACCKHAPAEGVIYIAERDIITVFVLGITPHNY
jgi:hypothetical protein